MLAPSKAQPPLSGTGLGLLLTGFVFTLAFFFVIMLATRLGQEFANFARGHFHGDRRE
jgi:hypothetical protein